MSTRTGIAVAVIWIAAAFIAAACLAKDERINGLGVVVVLVAAVIATGYLAR